MTPNWKRSGLIYIVILLAIVALSTMLFSTPQKATEIPLSKMISMSQNNQIREIIEKGEWATFTTIDGQEQKTNIGMLNYNDLRELGLNTDIEYDIQSGGIEWGNLLFSFLPLLLFGGLLFFLLFRARGANSQALSFGRSRARLSPTDKPKVTFKDVAGIDEAQQELYEVVEFLKSREKFEGLGARIPRGVLLVGPPGTGKTLLAKAVAGEADVPFFSISGSEFVEMFVGVGASRVRDLFEQAKRNTPCIIFVDEIDAVGRQRGSGLGGSHDEREQTLNQILTEMDGFDTNTGVIVLAATNRPDILDPALLRPGRFDRRVILDNPDIVGRTAILQVHARGKPMAKTVSLEVIAKQTVGFSGADLANLLNEAAILAARRNKKTIGMVELEESIDRVIAGPEKKSRKISPREKEITAYHEAGHALVARLLPNADPVHKISIVSRGVSLGHTRQIPAEDRYLMTRSQFKDMMATFLGGHSAEKLIFDEITTGASDDIERATKMARAMVTRYGMSDKLGPRTFGQKQEMVFLGREISEQRDYSERVAEEIDDEVRAIVLEAQEVARQLLTQNKTKLIRIAKRLIIRETLEGKDLDKLIDGTTPQPKKPKPTATNTPAPIVEGKPEPAAKPKRSPGIPRLLPEQNPAASD